MKIKFAEKQKKYITVSQLPAVRKIISDMRDDNGLKDYAEIAVSLAADMNAENFEILKADAEIALNSRIWNHYGDGTENLDIWITVYAYDSYYGFYDVGVYLSDIWALCRDNRAEIRQQMYIQHYALEG